MILCTCFINLFYILQHIPPDPMNAVVMLCTVNCEYKLDQSLIITKHAASHNGFELTPIHVHSYCRHSPQSLQA